MAAPVFSPAFTCQSRIASRLDSMQGPYLSPKVLVDLIERPARNMRVAASSRCQSPAIHTSNRTLPRRHNRTPDIRDCPERKLLHPDGVSVAGLAVEEPPKRKKVLKAPEQPERKKKAPKALPAKKSMAAAASSPTNSVAVECNRQNGAYQPQTHL
jgi:hypothetical protein